MRLGRLWVGVGDGAKKILSLAYSYLNDFVKKILSFAYSYLNGYAKKILSLAYPYLNDFVKKILSLVVNKSKLRLQQASFLNLSFVYSLAYPYLCKRLYS